MNIEELKIKKERLWGLLESKGLEGVLLNRRSNFAWFTGGGDNHIFLCSEMGNASLLILRDKTYVLAQSMDGLRLMDEQVSGLGYELAQYYWFEGQNSQLDRLVAGKKIGSDTPSDRFVLLSDLDFRSIIFPLTPSEIKMSRDIGRSWEDAILEVCSSLETRDNRTRSCRQVNGCIYQKRIHCRCAARWFRPKTAKISTLSANR